MGLVLCFLRFPSSLPSIIPPCVELRDAGDVLGKVLAFLNGVRQDEVQKRVIIATLRAWIGSKLN